MCPHCRYRLSPIDLIPVMSWVVLRGKCRHCRKPISLWYPLVEIATAFLFLLSYAYWPISFNGEGIIEFVIWLICLGGFVALSVYDLKWRLLPNKVVTPLILLATLLILVKLVFFGSGTSLIIGAFWGLIFSAGLFYGLFILSRGEWIGGGDVKLAFVLGLLLGGPSRVILMIFLASAIGSLTSVILIITRHLNRNSRIAFGPLLIVGTVISYLFGVHIIDWYINLIF